MNYKPLLMALMAAAAVAPASAYTCLPPAGAVDMEAYPSGLSGFEITSDSPLSINRDAPGFITLSRNGKAVKQIPASNTRDLYTYLGFDKRDAGDIHVTFYERQQTSPFRYMGDYTVTVPAGFFTDTATGAKNQEITVSYTIDSPEMVFSPAAGSVVKSLSEVVINFKDVEKVSKGFSSNKEFVYTFTPADGSASTEVALTSNSYTISGSDVTFSFPQPFEDAGKFTIVFPAGAFRATSPTGIEGKNVFCSYSVEVNPEAGSPAAYSVAPAPGDYEGFTSEKFESIDKYAFFKVSMPEGKEVSGYPIRVKPLLVSVVDGVADVENPRFTFAAQASTADNAVYIYNGNLNKATGDFGYKAEETITPAAGDYMLYLPAKLISFKDGSSNEALSFKYTALPSQGAYNYSITPEPDKRVELPVSEVRVDFPEAPNAQWVSGQFATLSNGVAEYVLPGVAADIDGDGSVVTITIPGGITEAGVYTLYIPMSALLIDGNPTGVRAKLYLGVDNGTVGVEEVLEVEVEDNTLYTIDGIRLDDRASAARGIYVRNGKTVVVK